MSSQREEKPGTLLLVSSVGMVCSVGLNAASSCAAVRARIARFLETPFHDGAGQPIIAAAVPEVLQGRQGPQRLAPLLAGAIRDCLRGRSAAVQSSGGAPILLVAIDDLHRPDYFEELPQRLLADVQGILGVRFASKSQVVAGGKTGFFRTLEQARELLRNGVAESCLVAAVDSFINSRALRWLEEQDRLKTELNSDGIIPGEAAAALWVTRSESDGSGLLEIQGLGFAEERSPLEDDQPNLAIGLAEALRRAMADAGLSLAEIDFRVGGMAGERLEFMEASTALARIQRVHKESFELWVPAEKLGDTGAALPACMIVLTSVGIAKGYAPGRRALLSQSSQSAERAACVVAAPAGGRSGM